MTMPEAAHDRIMTAHEISTEETDYKQLLDDLQRAAENTVKKC